MSDIETRFHETWLGMVQPIEGLVVSVPVLVDAQCMARQSPAAQRTLRELTLAVQRKDASGGRTRKKADEDDTAPRRIADLERFFQEVLELTPDLFDREGALPEDLSLYVPEGRQTLRPTLGLRRLHAEQDEPAGDSTPAAQAGARYVALVWELPAGLELDKPETTTGPWDYPPSAKFDRLLRHCQVPIGLLTTRDVVRLVYAPHGESSGAITFDVTAMASVGGRPIFDAFVMLLSASRFFGVARNRQLPELLRQSRERQADVTSELADQVFEALEILLAGFEAAAERDGDRRLRDALEQDADGLYGGLLTVLLRLVFVLYAEDRGLLPVDSDHYSEHLSVLELFDELLEDRGAYPDSMSRRFGAWPRLLALFRAIYLGVQHGELHMPPRRGELFDPNRYSFLEGWGPAGSAPIVQASARAGVRVPSIDDDTVYRVLEKLLILKGQRLSYRALDVEQIGSVYEALMGYHVLRLDSPAVRIGPAGVWLTAGEVLAESPARREKHIKELTGLSKAQSKKIAAALKGTTTDADAFTELQEFRSRKTEPAPAGRLVLQPGSERRRTSSHYTPRSLTEPIVEKTLAPLIATIARSSGKDAAPSDLILELKICDPAMGSGAFLVAACRYLADQLVAAWTREGRLDKIASTTGDVTAHARRLVAQRCLYGVDKNAFAVGLAKLSLWLVTLAKDDPFTFVDHALRHGDSLVGLSLDQIRAFHWKPKGQLELFTKEIDAALDEGVALRRQILERADDDTPAAAREKERLLWDAEDALDRVRLIGDVCVGAFFAEQKDKAREKERNRRLDLVNAWLRDGGLPTEELRELQAEIRARLPVLHWHIELPEVFYEERPDPLEGGAVNGAAYLDAFVGNPPFLGGKRISTEHGDSYADWLIALHSAGKNGDLSAHFFRRADSLLGAHGTVGLIGTNTIAQGDTRATGLQWLVRHGHQIYDATRSMLWPGDAAVAVAVVHTGKGDVLAVAPDVHLDGKEEEAINSRLRGKPERDDPLPLRTNADCAFVGSYVLGMGFTLTPEERDTLVQRAARNAERIFPYLGGEEVNSSPTQTFDRYVINFGAVTLAEAKEWPDLIEIVERRVKPERDKVKREAHRKYWWHYGDKRPALYAALAGLPRCLVNSQVSKHLVLAFQPVDRVFGHTLYVYPLPNYSGFAGLQSRIHEFWARLLASSLEDRLRYSASDCFETFPFPVADPRTVLPELETAGERLYTARADFMVRTNQGLTQTYNLLKNPTCTDAAIIELRKLHEDLDRAVLAAYGWDDVEVPAYCGAPPSELERFEDEVIDRLFVLNAQRAEEERIAGKRSRGR